jgi:hypothetical protein
MNIVVESGVDGEMSEKTITIKRLDYGRLQPLSENKIKSNHETKAFDSDVCKCNTDLFVDNIKNYLLSTSVFECSSLLISENNWFNRKGNTEYKDKNGNDLTLLPCQIIQIDLGKNYDVECGLIHYGLIIKVLKDKVLIVPMTTTDNEYFNAFHPVENPNGKFHLRRGLLSEGFTKNVTLYINDIRSISIGRLLPYKSVDIINIDAYNSIREHILRFYFSDIFKSLTAQIETIQKENERLKSENTELTNICLEINTMLKNVVDK